ncbi:MAG: hypothetical protein M3Q30_18105 [Actinomycetota bacterium]|nr:hypothetical protein [Actinomycetota bacterium]
MTEHPDRIERTLELLLYAPIGIGLFLKDAAPQLVDMFVSRGRAEIDRRQEEVQQQVTTARSLGQVALAFGAPMVRRRVEQTVADAHRRAGELLGSQVSDPSPARAETSPASPVAEELPSPAPAAIAPPPPTAEPPDTRDDPASATNGDLASRAGLPIPGYDALSASQVVERLIGLAPDELDAVHAYETSHRQRRTILGKIEQLAE